MGRAVRGAAAGALSFLAMGFSQPAGASDCAADAAALVRTEAELPHLDLTPPMHRELVCITLETLIDFAQRVGTHVGRCPGSAYADKAATWDEARKTYAAQFRQRRCRRTLRAARW